MKTAKKIISILLSITLCFSVVSVALAKEPGKTLTVFVDGINASPIINTDTGEQIFPPQADKIVSAVVKALPALLGSVITNDFTTLVEPLNKGIMDVCAESACDVYGVPAPNTDVDYVLPDDEEIMRVFNSADNHDRVHYIYDWRLDMITIATDLHDYLGHCMEITGAEGIDLIGFSMGGCAVMSYVALFGDEYLSSFVVEAGAYNGVTCCGQPFAGDVYVEGDATVRFVEAQMGEDSTALFVKALLKTLNEMGIIDDVAKIANGALPDMIEGVYKGAMAKTFASYPGMWALPDYENFVKAKELIFGGSEEITDEFIALIDWYMENVQLKNKELFDGLIANGVKVGIIAKYGVPITPAVKDINTIGDGVIDTKYESFGATCADTTGTLGDDYVQAVDNGHDCISPDNLIDSSTCVFCDYTWFVKNSIHANDLGPVMDLCAYIAEGDTQKTVWEGEYPQYLTPVNGKLVPLTAENDYSMYTVDFSEVNFIKAFFELIKAFFKLIIEPIKNLFA